jgi:hypothetical protein
MDTRPGQAAWTYGTTWAHCICMGMRHGHASWASGMGMRHGHAAWACSLGMQHSHGHASWTDMDMGMEIAMDIDIAYFICSN